MLTNKLSSSQFAMSYLPFVCWWLTMAAVILFALTRLNVRLPKPAAATIAGFAALLAAAFFSGYLYTIIVKGDSMDNMSYAMGVARGHFKYKSLAYLGYWKQLLYFQMAAPVCRVMGLSDRLPNTMLILSNWISSICLYLFLRTLKQRRVTAFLICSGMFFAVPIIFWQGTFLRQHIVPAFLLISAIFFHHALAAISKGKRKPALAHTLFLGLSIGVGFNIYDLNYLYGLVAAMAFMVPACWHTLFKHTIPVKWLLLILAAFTGSILIGTGPLASLSAQSPHILLARLKKTSPPVDYANNIQVFLHFHWMATTRCWIRKWMVFLLLPGPVLLLRKQYRHVRWLIIITLALLVALFIHSGHEGRRRAVSLLFFEYALMGLTVDYVLDRLHSRYPLFKTWITGILCGLLAVAMVGGNFLGSRSVRARFDHAAQMPRNSALIAYFHAIRDVSHLDNVYAFEPLESTSAVFWSGGRPDIHTLREPRNHIPEVFLSEDRIKNTVKTLSQNNESFAFIFFLQDDLTTYLNLPLGKRKHAYFRAIGELENTFLNALKTEGMQDIAVNTVFVKNRFLVRVHYRL